MISSSQKETYESNTPSGSSTRTSIDGVLHHRSSKETTQSYLSNSSVHTTTAVVREDLFGVSEQGPVSSNTRLSLILDDKSLHSLEKLSFKFGNQSQSTVCTIRDEIKSQANVGVNDPVIERWAPQAPQAPQPPTAPQQQSATITSSVNKAGRTKVTTLRQREKTKTDKANDADMVKHLQEISTDADPTWLHGLGIAEDDVPLGSADGHDIVGSPTATNGPHPFQRHPAQSSTSASPNNLPNIAIPYSPSLSPESPSLPRSSTEVYFVEESFPSAMAHRRNSLSTMQRENGTSRAQSDSNRVVEPFFDESVLRALCELDVSVVPKSRLSPSQLHPSSSAECLCYSIESNRA